MEKEKLNREIKATLNSLDGLERAEVSPYFYTRLQNRLQQPKNTLLHRLVLSLSRPVFAVSLLGVFLILNVATIINVSKTGPVNTNKAASLQSFAAEYNLTTNSVYPNTDN